MLLNLLPGFRELRAPLAAGYLWLFAGWLAFGGNVPAPAGAEEFFNQFQALGAAAALTFAAYLLGSFLTDLFNVLWLGIRLLRTGPIYGTGHTYPSSLEEKGRLRERLIRMQATLPLSAEGAAVLDDVARRAVEGIPRDERASLDEALFIHSDYTVRGLGGGRWIRGGRETYRPGDAKFAVDDPADALPLRVTLALGDELDVARFRLLSEESALFQEVDRLSAEGDFRIAVSTPLIAIAVVLGFTSSPLWFLAIFPLVVLPWLGMNRQEESGDRVVYAIRAGKVKTPFLEQLSKYEPDVAGALKEETHASGELAPLPSEPVGSQ